MNILKPKIIYLFALFLFMGCDDNKNELLDPNIVRVHIMNDPESLNPQCRRSALAGHIIQHLYQKLLSLDHKTNQLIPVLVNSQPLIETLDDGRLRLSMEIRKEAKWDNGKEITAEDVLFSIKLLKMPWVKNEHFKPYFEKVENVIIDEELPKKVSIIFKEAYIQAKWCLPDLFILPAHIIDPEGILKKVNIERINNRDFGEDSLAAMNLAMRFSSDDFQRNGDFVKGSGAYRLKEWYSGNRIILERKKEWWGDKMSHENIYFDAYPTKIIYEHIKSWAQVIVSVKKGLLDVVSMLPSKDFFILKETKSFNEQYNTAVSDRNAFEYIGINLKQEYLEDLRLREALSSIINIESIISDILQGMGSPIKSPYFAIKDLYHDKLAKRSYSPKQAEGLLKSAGWADSDNDGFLDKTINGELKVLKLKMIYNAGNSRRENIGLIFKEEARKVGIDLDLIAMEWSVYLEALRNHNYDLFIGGLGTSPQPPDPKQSWHTESYYNNGSNYFGFGDAETDQLIEDIRICMEKEEMRTKMFLLQEKIHNVIPCIFLYSLKNKIIIHNRFGDVKGYSKYPGFWEGELKVSL